MAVPASGGMRDDGLSAALPLQAVDRRGAADRPARVGRTSRFVVRLALGVLTFGAGGLLGASMNRNAGPAATASTPEATRTAAGLPHVLGLARLLPEGDVLTVGLPFGGTDTRVARIAVSEGQRVAPGDVLAVLDNEPLLAAAVQAAEATLAAREAMLVQTRANVVASRDEASATLARAQSAAQSAARDYERAEALRERGVATEALLDQRRSAREEALREVDRARATLQRYAGPDVDAQPDVLVAARNRDVAAADLARARTEREKAIVRAPIGGTVLTLHTRAGERVAQTGLLNLGNIDAMTAEIEIDQTRIGAISVDDRVELTAPLFTAPLEGRVTRVGLEVVRQSLIDASPAANTDARVVRVTASLTPEASARARGLTNMQVLARILPRSRT